MNGMFLGATFNQPLNSWDVSSVTNMADMFWDAAAFNGDISTWNVSSVTDMTRMFQEAFSFNQPLNSWDVSSVTDMADMFWGADSFNQPLNSWDVSSVTDMSQMFYEATSFNQPLDRWDVSSVTDMTRMFQEAFSFNQPLNSWDVSSVTDMSYMFFAAISFNQNLGDWYIVLDSVSIDRADVPGVVGTISAQNPFLDGQNPTYLIEPGDDSYWFAITGGNRLSMVSVDANRTTYTVTIAATGGSVFEGGNNRLTVEATLVDDPHDTPPAAGQASPVISGPSPISVVFDGSGGFDALDGANDVDVFGVGNRTYAIVAAWDDGAVQIMDVTDPTNPAPVSAVFGGSGGFVTLNGANGVEAFGSGNRTYAIVTATYDGAIQIMDVTDPGRPVPVSAAFDGSGGFVALAGANDMAVFGVGNRTYAIVTAYNDNGVQIMDITDPGRPVPVSAAFDGSGGFTTLGGPHDVAVFGSGDRTYAIVTADNDNGVQIMDVTDPGRPAPVSAAHDGLEGFRALNEATNVEVFESGGRTYAIVTAFSDDGVQIMDVTDPGRPAPVSATYDGSVVLGALDGVNGVEVFGSGGRTYVIVTAINDDGVQIMDVTDPGRPASTTFDSGGFIALNGAEDVEVFGSGSRTYAIVAAPFDDDAIQIMDITDPGRPSPVSAVTDGSGGFTTMYGANDVEVFGSGSRTYAIVVVSNNDEHVVQIMDVTDPGRPAPISAIFGDSEGFATLRLAEDVEVFGSGSRTYAIVTTGGNSGIQIMDITDPGRPAPVSAVSIGWDGFGALRWPNDVEVFGSGNRTYAIVTGHNDGGVQIMDITDPARPAPVSAVFDGSGGFDALRGAEDVEVFGSGNRTYAIVTGHNDGGVQIMDITDPARPAPVSAVFDGSGGFDALRGAEDVEVFGSGNRTYAIVTASSDSGAQIMDITDPGLPAPVSAVFDDSMKVDVESGLSQEWADVVLAATNSTELAGTVFGVGDRTYAVVAALYDNATQITDITDPTNPAPVSAVFDGSEDLGALASSHDVEVFGVGDRTYAVVAASYDGSVQIMNVTDPANPSSVSVVLDGPGERGAVDKENDAEVFGSGDRTYAVVATLYGGGVRIIDVTDPANPSSVSAVLDGPGELGDMSIRLDVEIFGIGNRTYAIMAAWPDGGVRIIDVTDPANPSSVSAVLDGSELRSSLSAPFGVEVFGDGDRTYAIMTSTTSIDIMDITDPTDPTPVQQNATDGLLGSYVLFVPYHMDVFGSGDRTYAIITTVIGGVHIIIDITDPTNPTLVWPVDETSDVLSPGLITLFVDVFGSGDRTYAITSFLSTGTRIVDITDPFNPVLVSTNLGLAREG